MKRGGSHASDALCGLMEQSGFDRLATQQTNLVGGNQRFFLNHKQSGGTSVIPSLSIPESSSGSHGIPLSDIPNQITPDISLQAVYPLYYSLNYSPPLTYGGGSRPTDKKKERVVSQWKDIKSPRPK